MLLYFKVSASGVKSHPVPQNALISDGVGKSGIHRLPSQIADRKMKTNTDSSESMPSWHAAKAADLETINCIADIIHTDLPERPEVFAEKFNLFPEGCFVLGAKGTLVGYGLAHPWPLSSIPPLDTFLNVLPSSPECIYIHDVAVLPEARGHGAAGAFVEIISQLAKQRSITSLALVSVYNTHNFWERYGFRVVVTEELTEKLESYGSTARYMVRKLD